MTSTTNKSKSSLTVTQQIASAPVISQQTSIDNFFSPEFLDLALKHQSIGLMCLTPLGVGCPWYSNRQEWLEMEQTCEKRRDTPFYALLIALIRNTLKEEEKLALQLARPSNKLKKAQSDLYAAFQSLGEVERTNHHSDGRVHRAHIMTCLVDRLLWASGQDGSHLISLPIQFPHHSYPEGQAFERYTTFIQSWSHVIQCYKQVLHSSNLQAIPQHSERPILSLFLTMKSSSQNRILNTVLDNFTRCALAIRALTYVFSFLSHIRYIAYFNYYRKLIQITPVKA
jgi:hypothetical protein